MPRHSESHRSNGTVVHVQDPKSGSMLTMRFEKTVSSVPVTVEMDGMKYQAVFHLVPIENATTTSDLALSMECVPGQVAKTPVKIMTPEPSAKPKAPHPATVLPGLTRAAAEAMRSAQGIPQTPKEWSPRDLPGGTTRAAAEAVRVSGPTTPETVDDGSLPSMKTAFDQLKAQRSTPVDTAQGVAVLAEGMDDGAPPKFSDDAGAPRQGQDVFTEGQTEAMQEEAARMRGANSDRMGGETQKAPGGAPAKSAKK